MNEKPSYYAVIPASVRYADIVPNAKLLFGEITALCNREGFCWASNTYFANLYHVNVTTISEWIRQLKVLGAIDYEVDGGRNRKIVLREKPNTASGKAEATASGKAEHNNTEENNTVNNQSEALRIGEVLKLFEVVNPAFQGLFKNTTERSAAKWLIDKYGFDDLKKKIEFLPRIIGKPYAPRITTPYALKAKMGELIAYLSQEQQKKSKNQVAIIT